MCACCGVDSISCMLPPRVRGPREERPGQRWTSVCARHSGYIPVSPRQASQRVNASNQPCHVVTADKDAVAVPSQNGQLDRQPRASPSLKRTSHFLRKQDDRYAIQIFAATKTAESTFTGTKDVALG